MLVRLAGIAVPLLVWEAASRFGLLHSVFAPPFSRALARAVALPVESPGDFVMTGVEIVLALVATGLGGVTLGVLLARSERIDALLGRSDLVPLRRAGRGVHHGVHRDVRCRPDGARICWAF